MLEFIYRMMQHSIPLLEEAIRLSTPGELRDYFQQHIDEEIGHDEILLDDIQRAGIEDIPEYIEAMEIIGMQYYLLRNRGPFMLLGYMAALERESPQEEQIVALEKFYGTEMKCIRLHAKLDVKHIQDLEDQISKLTEDQQRMVEANERYTFFKLDNSLNLLVGRESHGT